MSRDIGSTVGKPCDQCASIVTLPTQTNAWTDAKMPVSLSASPAVCSRRPLSSPPPSLFCSLSFLSLLFHVCYSSSFLTSRPFDAASRCSQLFNMSSPPVSGVLCLIFVTLKEFTALTPALFFMNLYELVVKRVRFDSTVGMLLFQMMLHIYQHAHPPGRPHTTNGLHTHTNAYCL